jgi:hypothetical protein
VTIWWQHDNGAWLPSGDAASREPNVQVFWNWALHVECGRYLTKKRCCRVHEIPALFERQRDVVVFMRYCCVHGMSLCSWYVVVLMIVCCVHEMWLVPYLRSIPEYSIVFLSIPQYYGVFQNIPVYSGVFHAIPEYSESSWLLWSIPQ